MDISGVFKTLVSISQFNKGKASPLFARAEKGETLIVIKNNAPVAVIMSPQEYEILRAFPKACQRMDNLMTCAELDDLFARLKRFDGESD